MSRKKINENPGMTGINRLKNLGKQQDASLGGIQPQLLAKAMQQASQGKSVSGAYSQQLGLLLNVLAPVMQDSSALQRLMQISAQVKDKQQGNPEPEKTAMMQSAESIEVTEMDQTDLQRIKSLAAVSYTHLTLPTICSV